MIFAIYSAAAKRRWRYLAAKRLWARPRLPRLFWVIGLALLLVLLAASVPRLVRIERTHSESVHGEEHFPGKRRRGLSLDWESGVLRIFTEEEYSVWEND